MSPIIWGSSVDFHVVSRPEKMHAKVGIESIGTAPAVKEFNALITHVLSEVEGERLPQDLPERFQVDISSLAAIGDRVCVQDIVVSDQVKILADPEEIIAVAPRPPKKWSRKKSRQQKKPRPQLPKPLSRKRNRKHLEGTGTNPGRPQETAVFLHRCFFLDLCTRPPNIMIYSLSSQMKQVNLKYWQLTTGN
ncbi:MAG: hypothetical protein ACOZF2_10930 [Thermodesulfobacteriota bacterium]